MDELREKLTRDCFPLCMVNRGPCSSTVLYEENPPTVMVSVLSGGLTGPIWIVSRRFANSLRPKNKYLRPGRRSVKFMTEGSIKLDKRLSSRDPKSSTINAGEPFRA